MYSLAPQFTVVIQLYALDNGEKCDSAFRTLKYIQIMIQSLPKKAGSTALKFLSDILLHVCRVHFNILSLCLIFSFIINILIFLLTHNI